MKPTAPKIRRMSDVIAAQEWRSTLLYRQTKTGPVLKPIAANAAVILSSDEMWAGVLAYSEFLETC